MGSVPAVGEVWVGGRTVRTGLQSDQLIIALHGLACAFLNVFVGVDNNTDAIYTTQHLVTENTEREKYEY